MGNHQAKLEGSPLDAGVAIQLQASETNFLHFLGAWNRLKLISKCFICMCMSAAVCRKPGEPLVIEEIMVAPPMAREVRIRIICTSLCQSDITFWKLKVGVHLKAYSF